MQEIGKAEARVEKPKWEHLMNFVAAIFLLYFLFEVYRPLVILGILFLVYSTIKYYRDKKHYMREHSGEL
ncbi:MAG: hypothetical protein INQ03_02450 [Candidatus Heimdallarchaeota archaeon]|nr:hypothetical protein [Candidatus Heimdallarchaeota archaeon]